MGNVALYGLDTALMTQIAGVDDGSNLFEAFAMYNRNLDAALASSKAVFAVEKAGLVFPKNSLIFNATKPLAGKALSCEDSISGSHYSCVDLDDPQADSLIRRNNDMDAAIILKVSKQEAIDLLMLSNSLARKYAQYSLERQFQLLSREISKIERMPYHEAVNLLGMIREF